VEDGDVCGKTSAVNGDLVTGKWTFNSRLFGYVSFIIDGGCTTRDMFGINSSFRSAIKQSLTISVRTGRKDDRIPVVSVTVKVAELFARVKDQVNGTDNSHLFFYCINEYPLN
jgi:hypothetical protein